MKWLSHHHRWLNCHSHGQAARPGHLGMRLSSMHPKPSSWLHVNGPAASITTSKVATSLPWWTSSTTSSSAWSQQVSSLSILAGGSYSACMVVALLQALKLAGGPCLATWSPGPPAQILDATSKVTHGAGTCSGTKSSVGGASPTSASFFPLFFLHQLLHGHPLLLHLHYILAWS